MPSYITEIFGEDFFFFVFGHKNQSFFFFGKEDGDDTYFMTIRAESGKTFKV